MENPYFPKSLIDFCKNEHIQNNLYNTSVKNLNRRIEAKNKNKNFTNEEFKDIDMDDYIRR